MATENDGMLIGRGSIRRVFDSTREVETSKGIRNRAGSSHRGHAIQIVEGVLLEDLAAASDPETPTSGKFQIKTSLQSADGWASLPVPNEATAKNRFPTDFAAGDVALFAELYPDKWFIMGSGGSSGGGNAACPCTCLETGDILVNGIATTSRWQVTLPIVKFEQANGDIRVPAGAYTVVWDEARTLWVFDVGDALVAYYNDGSSATADTTMDGEITLEWASLVTQPELKVCVTGTVPAP